MKSSFQFLESAKNALGHRTFNIFLALILLRFISLGLYPLMDTTEARYGEIARKMAEMNDWITPWFDIGIPFWGKPPLSFWMSALGIKLFGVNEFALRVPHFIAAVLVAAMCYDWAKRCSINAFYVLVIISTTFLFMISSGAVITDMALSVGSTLAMRSFWLCLRGDPLIRKREQWLFFLGLSVMLLAKGPVGWVLVLLPIGLWAILSGAIKETWSGLPWLIGSILSIAIVTPWYLIAEQHTPGFLHYFFVGEHWQRFTVSGWEGDLYGNAHARPRGTIWLDFILASLPWNFIIAIFAWIYRKQFLAKLRNSNTTNKSLKLYLLLLVLSPCVFFTMSSNILWTYVLPGLPAFALLLGTYLSEINEARAKKFICAGVISSFLILLGVLIALTIGNRAELKSAKLVVETYQHLAQTTDPKPALVFLYQRPYSAMFYSRGKALSKNSLNEINALADGKPIYIAIQKKQLAQLTNQLDELKQVADVGNYTLYLSK